MTSSVIRTFNSCCVYLIMLALCSIATAQSSILADAEFYETAPAPSPGSCPLGSMNATLNPEVTQGPYYLEETLLRTNITEGQGGLSLEMHITVLDTNCNPVVGAFIDIWHCNATGVYSGYTGISPGGTLAPAPSASRKMLQASQQTDNSTFLRGTVQTDENGVAIVQTIVPGWYTGRVTHIHAMTHVPNTALDSNALQEYENSHVSHVGQFYFQDDLLTAIYQLQPYSRHTGQRTALADDMVYISGGSDPTQIFDITYKSPANLAAGLISSVTAVIDPSANNTATSGMGAMGGLGMGSAPGSGFPGGSGGPMPAGLTGLPMNVPAAAGR